jgi:hypothetical protein
MNFVKKMFDKRVDEFVHIQFQKFSKGEFRDRAVINAKFSKGKYTIFCGAEYANELVHDVAKKLGVNKTMITGVIVSTQDLKGQLDFSSVKQFQGVKQYIMNKEMSGNEIIALMNKFPKNFFALTFGAPDGTELKIKAKAPKSAKAGAPKAGEEGQGPKADFCKIITTDANIGKSFIFEVPVFDRADINHTYFIRELVMPKGETDFAKIRELAKRKGEIIRKAQIDGKEIVTKIELEA